MAIARDRRDGGLNYWPGFVDALSTLVLGIIFLLTVFMVVQFYLTQEVTGKDTELTGQLDAERRLTARALAQVEVLNQQIAQLRRQLAALEQALEASESKDKDSQARIADLGQRLNVALAQRVQELSRFRSDFFGRLRAILGNRPDI